MSLDLLHICFDHCTEYDSDVVFDKNAIFSAFFKSRGSVLYFDVLHAQIFIQQTILGGYEIFVKIIKNAGGGWQLFSKTLAGKS